MERKKRKKDDLILEYNSNVRSSFKLHPLIITIIIIIGTDGNDNFFGPKSEEEVGILPAGQIDRFTIEIVIFHHVSRFDF